MAAEFKDRELGQIEALFEPSMPMYRGDYLYRAGDRTDYHYHVRSGMFKTYAINTCGDEYVTGFFLPGEILGCAQLDDMHTDSAVALETATVCELAESDIERCADLGLTSAFYKRFAEREVQAAQHHLNLIQSSADARVAGFLIDLSRRLSHLGRCPNHIPTPMSRTDISNFIGMTLETLSRVISRLVKAGVVQASKNYIEILLPDSLQLIGLHMTR